MYAKLFTAALAAVAVQAVPFQSRSNDALSGRASSQTFPPSNETNGYVSIVENSGVCETTPGVTTYSGYINLANDTQHYFFWFFEARNNPEKAPFTVFLSGGPGCSSMSGLFQENGPCTVNLDNKTTSLNPYSWNNYANMIYIDQPIGAGFSYGSDFVNSTEAAAIPVWQLFQCEKDVPGRRRWADYFSARRVLFDNGHFDKYESRDFGLWTQGYGGHYAPEFVRHFEDQNAKIDNGTISGTKLNLMSLGIGNGAFDPLIQDGALPDYARYNPYRQMINESMYAKATDWFTTPGGCRDQQMACYVDNKDQVCIDAENWCLSRLYTQIIGKANPYDITTDKSLDFPSRRYINFLNSTDVRSKIGAKVPFASCPPAIYTRFAATGDDSKTVLPELQTILTQGNLRTLIWAGDLVYLNNYMGIEQCLSQSGWNGAYQFNSMNFRDVHYQGNGSVYGQAKTVGNMTYLRFYGAGNDVPAYRPAAAYEAFVSTLKGEWIK